MIPMLGCAAYDFPSSISPGISVLMKEVAQAASEYYVWLSPVKRRGIVDG
jgi:hypothetical protein